jgi:uncharacterized protein (TIGR00725 family)
MKKRKVIVGVMGGSAADQKAYTAAHRLGYLIAGHGWILLNGGRRSGIMAASAKGASENGGITVGILPEADRQNVSEHIDIPIVTGMGQARNIINVLSSDIIVACKGGAGTLSEIALAVKSRKPVILLGYSKCDVTDVITSSELVYFVDSPETAVEVISGMVSDP